MTIPVAQGIPAHSQRLISWPATYLRQGLIAVLVYPCSKRPIPDPKTGSLWQFSELDDLEEVLGLHPRFNLALRCHGIAQVDCDSNEALAWARARGLTSQGAWVLRTARGWRVLYRAPNPCPATHTDPTHRMPDLLAPGCLALVPPSIHPIGFPYAWAPGHSPVDDALGDLAALPDPILIAWRELKQDRRIEVRHVDAPGWLGLIFRAVCDYLAATGHRLRQARDGSVITTCPLHEDHAPSLSIHPERGWKCWAGCGEGRLTLLAARGHAPAARKRHGVPLRPGARHPGSTVCNRAHRENWQAQHNDLGTSLVHKTCEKTLEQLVEKASQLDLQAVSVAWASLALLAKQLIESIQDGNLSLGRPGASLAHVRRGPQDGPESPRCKGYIGLEGRRACQNVLTRQCYDE